MCGSNFGEKLKTNILCNIVYVDIPCTVPGWTIWIDRVKVYVRECTLSEAAGRHFVSCLPRGEIVASAAMCLRPNGGNTLLLHPPPPPSTNNNCCFVFFFPSMIVMKQGVQHNVLCRGLAAVRKISCWNPPPGKNPSLHTWRICASREVNIVSPLLQLFLSHRDGASLARVEPF